MFASIKLCRATAFGAILALALTAPAFATTLATASLDVASDDCLVCRVVNLGAKQITVTAQVVSVFDGTALAGDDLEVDPGEADLVTACDQDATGYCRFDGTFNKASVRASLDVFEQASQRTILVVPAQ